MNSKKGKKLHLEIILFFIVSIYCLLAPNRETCMDDTWISSLRMVGFTDRSFIWNSLCKTGTGR